MTGYKRVNYYELCRLCTSSQPKDKIHIFRDEGRKMQLQQKIQTCFPLLVCEHDYLPKVVCTTCIQTLDQCYLFRQNCINSETMLSSYFSNFRFTDDFKKAGKVYVKDTGQKLENISSNSHLTKKLIEDNSDASILQEGNQQFFALELPSIPNRNIQNHTKLTRPTNIISNKPTNNEYININQNQFPAQKMQTDQINYNLKTNNNQQNVLPCNITSINSNSNVIQNNKNNYESKLNIDPNTDFNMIKNNIVQPMMLIDVEQLIESGLPECEVNKLKEVFLKQQTTTNPPKITNNEANNVLNNLNNNNQEIKNDFFSTGKSFKCDICEKVFKRREHLYQHTKLHSGLRPFNCIHCPKTFSRKEHLMRHLTSHSGKKDFTCDVCDKKFSRPDNLKKHKKTHMKSGPFICEICQKTFVIKHYYLAHKLQHHEGGAVLNVLKVEDDL